MLLHAAAGPGLQLAGGAGVLPFFIPCVCYWVRLLGVGGYVMVVGGRTALLVVLRDQGSGKLVGLCMCVAVVVWGVAVWVGWWVGGWRITRDVEQRGQHCSSLFTSLFNLHSVHSVSH